jgi:metal iron transporter
MKGLRAFEFFVMALVLGVVICFCIQLSLIKDTPVSDVFRGYLPSTGMLQNGGLYQACGILGATVMPHSLYLGSGICQPRLYDYDVKIGNVVPMSQDQPTSSIASEKVTYQPSLTAINFCMKYSIVELALSLFTFALFVNSAILIVAGASLYASDSAAEASLFGIYDLLSGSIAPAAGTIFALALLLSGISAGIVCTIAGQMVSEGALNWTIAPWMRRLITRSISITPSIIIAGAVGREGLTAALSGSQVALSVALPFISAPLIYFTCRNKYMTVKRDQASTLDENVPRGVSSMEMEGTTADLPRQPIADEAAGREESGDIKMRNHWVTASFAAVVWLIITIMNIANLALLGIGH